MYSIHQGLLISDFLIYTYMSTPGEMEKHAAAEVKYTGNSSAEAMRMTEGDKHR